MRTPARPAALLAGLAIFAVPLAAAGQTSTQRSQTSTSGASTNAAGTPRHSHSDLLAAMEKSLSDGAPDKVRLTPAQRREIEAQSRRFQDEVRAFLRAHAGKSAGRGDDEVPDAAAAERRMLETLKPEQRVALEGGLREMVERKMKEAKNAAGHGRDSRSSSDHSSSSNSSSSHSSQSNSDSSSHSSSDHKKDSSSQSDSSSQKNSSSDQKSDKKSDRSESSGKGSSGGKRAKDAGGKNAKSSSNAARPKKSWSKLDESQRREVVRDLLDQLPADDRAKLAAELGVEPAKR